MSRVTTCDKRKSIIHYTVPEKSTSPLYKNVHRKFGSTTFREITQSENIMNLRVNII